MKNGLLIIVATFLFVFANAAASVPADAGIRADDAVVLEAIERNFDDQILFLEETVNQNSGSLNIAGVKKAGAVYTRAFQSLGFETRWIDMPEEMARAGHFVATRHFGNKRDKGPKLLLIGHIDTVFEENSPFQKFERNGDIAKGPGVNDMKGGNAVILYAVKALLEAEAIQTGSITVFFTGDEEAAGKPLSISRRDLIKAGKNADVALNFEGGSNEWAVIGRRGSSGWSLEVTAPQAHSSGIFSDRVGAGAAFELARILNRFYGEVRGPFGLTFNPGIVASGTLVEEGASISDQSVYGKTNVVAQKAVAHGGLRFMNADQLEVTRVAMAKIVEDNLPGTQATITFRDSYPAMEETDANKELLTKLNAVHARLGLKPAKSFPPERRGAADISFVAPYVTSMDGLGVAGQGAHSPREEMSIASMKDATRRAALLIGDLLAEKD